MNFKFTRALSKIRFLKERKFKYQRNKKASEAHLHVMVNVLHLKLSVTRRKAGIRYNNTA